MFLRGVALVTVRLKSLQPDGLDLLVTGSSIAFVPFVIPRTYSEDHVYNLSHQPGGGGIPDRIVRQSEVVPLLSVMKGQETMSSLS